MSEITLAMASKMLGISRQALSKHRRLGHITARKIGTYYVVDEDEVRQQLLEYLNRPGQKYKRKVGEPKETPPPEYSPPEVKETALSAAATD